MTMLIIDAARLLIFPSVMAFAASSDLFTMTISNRISLILVAGFGLLALGTGMPASEILQHVGAGGLVGENAAASTRVLASEAKVPSG